jgi:hypothetical protein
MELQGIDVERKGIDPQQPPATEIAPNSTDETVKAIRAMISELTKARGFLKIRVDPCSKIIGVRKAIDAAELLIKEESNHPELKQNFAALKDSTDNTIIALDEFEKDWDCA